MKGMEMARGVLRRRIVLVGACSALALGMLASAQAAVAAPFVRYAHFTRPSANFYAGFGDLIDISVAGSPSKTVVCVSGTCRQFTGGEIHVAGGNFKQFWAHGQSRQVKIYACNSICMTSVWVRQLPVP
jgi:hypothetical protein